MGNQQESTVKTSKILIKNKQTSKQTPKNKHQGLTV